MPDIFDDTIDSVREQKNAAAAGAPPDSQSEVSASEGQGAQQAEPDPQSQPLDQTPIESLETAGEGAREGEGKETAQATTGTEDQQSTFDKLTGLETEADLRTRHGDNFAAAFTRRFQPVIREAGGMPMLRHGAQLVSAINDPATDAEGFAKLASAVSPSRWAELESGIVGRALASDLPPEQFTARVRQAAPFIWRAIDAEPDSVLRGILGDETTTVDELRQALADHRYYGGQEQQGKDEAAQQGEDDLSKLSPALRKKLEDYDRLMQEVPGLRQQVTGMVERQQTEQEQARKQKVNELGQELYQSVFSVAAERRNKLGLEAKPSDTPRVRGIKKSLRDALSDDALEAAFESNPDRKALSERVLDKVNRLERDGAFAFRDPLAVMAEMTFQEVVESEEVKSLLDALKSELQAQSTPKDPSARPELVAGAPAAAAPADAWRSVPKDVDPFDYGASLVRNKAQAGG